MDPEVLTFQIVDPTWTSVTCCSTWSFLRISNTFLVGQTVSGTLLFVSDGLSVSDELVGQNRWISGFRTSLADSHPSLASGPGANLAVRAKYSSTRFPAHLSAPRSHGLTHLFTIPSPWRDTTVTFGRDEDECLVQAPATAGSPPLANRLRSHQ